MVIVLATSTASGAPGTLTFEVSRPRAAGHMASWVLVEVGGEQPARRGLPGLPGDQEAAVGGGGGVKGGSPGHLVIHTRFLLVLYFIHSSQ